MKASPYEAIPEAEIQTHIPTAELFPISKEHTTYHVPLNVINIANQMRPDSDYGDIFELAESISAVGVKQPVRAYRWDAETTRTYLQLNNSIYPEKVDKEIDDFTPLEDGSYLVLSYGHRRFVASHLALKDDIPTQIIEDGTIAEALQDQTVENIYHPPEPYAFARSINEVYKLQLASGLVKNQTEFSRKCGIGTDRLRSAIRFCSLPWEIQEMVIKGDLTYQKSVEIARFIPAVREYERENTSGEVPEDYLDFRVRSELARHVAWIKKSKFTYSGTATYVRRELRHYYGQSEISIMDDDARRDLQIRASVNKNKKMIHESLYSLGNVAVGVKVAELTDDIAEVVTKLMEPSMQRILGRLISETTLLADIAGFTPETRAQAQDALEGLRRLHIVDEPVMAYPGDETAAIDEPLLRFA